MTGKKEKGLSSLKLLDDSSKMVFDKGYMSLNDAEEKYLIPLIEIGCRKKMRYDDYLNFLIDVSINNRVDIIAMDDDNLKVIKSGGHKILIRKHELEEKNHHPCYGCDSGDCEVSHFIEDNGKVHCNTS